MSNRILNGPPGWQATRTAPRPAPLYGQGGTAHSRARGCSAAARRLLTGTLSTHVMVQSLYNVKIKYCTARRGRGKPADEPAAPNVVLLNAPRNPL